MATNKTKPKKNNPPARKRYIGGTSSGVSQWDDQSGNGNHLLPGRVHNQ